MLVLRRTSGQWVEVTHRSGDVLKFRIYDISGETPGRAHIAFDDDAHNFVIQRPERFARTPSAAKPTAQAPTDPAAPAAL